MKAVTFRPPAPVLFLIILLFSAAFGAFPQGYSHPYGESSALLDAGIELYAGSRWGEALVELRKAQQVAASGTVRAEAQFWIAMSELASGAYSDAIHDFDEIGRIDPLSIRRFEIPYQKARALFYLGDYNNAIVLFTRFADSIKVDGRYINGVRIDNWYAGGQLANSNDDYNRKAAAVYWIGECLYNLEQFDRAEDMFNIVVSQYNKSHKYEPSSNRLALIKQKKIEKELLDIVKWAGSQKSDGGTAVAGAVSNYNDAVLAYKNSIAPYILNGASKEEYTPVVSQPVPAQPVYDQPVQQTVPPAAAVKNQNDRTHSQSNPETMKRLLYIKDNALKTMDKLRKKLDFYENTQ